MWNVFERAKFNRFGYFKIKIKIENLPFIWSIFSGRNENRVYLHQRIENKMRWFYSRNLQKFKWNFRFTLSFQKQPRFALSFVLFCFEFGPALLSALPELCHQYRKKANFGFSQITALFLRISTTCNVMTPITF